MAEQLLPFIILYAIGIFVAVSLYRAVRPNLGGLLDKVVGLPDATEFYTKVLAILIALITTSELLSESFLFKDAPPVFMDYVWRIASCLKSLYANLAIYLGLYLVLMTILVATLRRKGK